MGRRPRTPPQEPQAVDPTQTPISTVQSPQIDVKSFSWANQSDLFTEKPKVALKRPTCVICGSDRLGRRIHAEARFELAPGVHRGVCHVDCFQRKLKEDRYDSV